MARENNRHAIVRCIPWFAAVVFSVGCATTDEAGSAKEDVSAVTSRIFYGTDRNRQDEEKPSRFYGLKRGVPSQGVAEVKISPADEKVILENVLPLLREDFFQQLHAAVQTAKSPTVMVFVHGFNRSFNNASKLAAEFAYSKRFDGVTVIWSWPSSRNPAGYLEDEANIRWSRPHLAEFLQDVIAQSGAERVHLLGHSMGARGLSEVMLRDLIPAGIDLDTVGEYVLLAPDIDSAIFKRDVAPALVGAGLHVSLYTSANDKALASAYALRSYPRAGDSRDGPIVTPGVETIDVTAANRSLLGHSYFDNSDEVSSDLAELLNRGKRASERNQLLYINAENGGYWQLTVGQ